MNFKYYVKVFSEVKPGNFSLLFSKAVRNLSKHYKPFYFSVVNKKSFDTEDPLIIFSEARGGSTWVMETLQRNLNAISIFEPLWGKEGAFNNVSRKHKFSSPFYFGNQDSEVALKTFLLNTFKGGKTSSRTLQFNSFKQLSKGEKLVVKLVNVNLIAPWLTRNFKLKYKPVYVIRHPLAILSSREKYSRVYKKLLENHTIGAFNRKRLTNKNHPYFDYLDQLDSADTRYNRYVAEWCIRNKDFVNGKYDDDFIIIYYEDMVLNPNSVLRIIEKKWGLQISRSNTYIESGTTAVGEKVLSGEKQLQKWLTFFKESEKEEFQMILDKFDIHRYTAFSPYLRKH